MNKAPAFMFYPDKFLAGTGHLSDKAFRVYMECLCWMWLHSPDHCSIKFRPEFIKKQLKLSKYVYANAWCNEIMDPDHPLLRVVEDRLVSNGLRKERAKQIKRSEAGKKGAEGRWPSSDCTETACDPQCLPIPLPVPLSVLTPDQNGESGITIGVNGGKKGLRHGKELQGEMGKMTGVEANAERNRQLREFAEEKKAGTL